MNYTVHCWKFTSHASGLHFQVTTSCKNKQIKKRKFCFHAHILCHNTESDTSLWEVGEGGVWPAGKWWQQHQRPPLVATRARASGVLLIRPCKHPGKTFEDWPNSNSNCPSPSFSFGLSLGLVGFEHGARACVSNCVRLCVTICWVRSAE